MKSSDSSFDFSVISVVFLKIPIMIESSENQSSLNGLHSSLKTLKEIVPKPPIDLLTTQSHPIFSKSVDFTASDQIPT